MDTAWRQNATAFENGLCAGWRDHRLVPHQFQAAGRARRVEIAEVRPFGTADLLPSEWLWGDRVAGLDNIAREWGREIALGEVRELFTALASRCAIDEGGGPVEQRVREARDELETRTSSVSVIFAPARWRVLSALALERGPVPTDVPGATAQRWYRGRFDDIPVFSIPAPGATDIWLVNYRELGWWKFAGDFDELYTRSDLRRDAFVRLDAAMVPATSVIAEEYIAIEIENNGAAKAVRVPLEADADR